jgi:hypothetical protein
MFSLDKNKFPEYDVEYLKRCILSKKRIKPEDSVYGLFGIYSFDKEHQLLLTIQYILLDGFYASDNTITFTKKEIEQCGVGFTAIGKRYCDRIEYLSVVGQMDKLWI